MPKISWEEVRAAVDEGLSGYQIARRFGMNAQSLYKRLRRHGISLRSQEKRLDEEGVKLLYGKGWTLKEIAENMGCSVKPVYKIIRRAGMSRKPGKVVRLHEDFFRRIETEEQAYWLGVMCADGSLGSGEQKTIVFTVKADDMEWVEAFKRTIGSDVRVTFVKNRWSGAAQCIVTSEKMHEDLCRLGVVPRKSKNVGLPEIEDELRRHMLRGLMDGDGTVMREQDGVSFATGSERMRDDLMDVLAEFRPKVYENGGTWKIAIYGEEARSVLRWMYDGATVFLRRKYRIYCERAGLEIERREGVRKIGLDVARVFIGQYHYLGTLKVSTVYGWFIDDELMGVAAIGSCSSPSVAATIFGEGEKGRVRELHRFCLKEGVPENTASMFLSRVLDEYGQEHGGIWAIVSYADRAQGHEGIIYRAVSAIEVRGSEDAQLVVIDPEGKRYTGRQRDILRAVEAKGYGIERCRLERSEGKRKFVMLLGSGKRKKERKKKLIEGNDVG